MPNNVPATPIPPRKKRKVVLDIIGPKTTSELKTFRQALWELIHMFGGKIEKPRKEPKKKGSK